MNPVNRRSFLKTSSFTFLPAIIPASVLLVTQDAPERPTAEEPIVYFFLDGTTYDPTRYLEQLQLINNKQPIAPDRYGNGGAIAALEKKFTEITGKEKAMFMPSGTMANQFAIAVLSGDNTKIFVQDTSHVYRDEADAAQSVFQKRLMPLAKDQTFFSADMLKEAVETLSEQEVFKSGVGAVSIENPVRRRDGRYVPIQEIKKISEYCRANNIKLHMDGARVHMASAWSGVSVKEYASYFDTIYISLYKYLGASSGAILCGDKTVMDKMPHLMKIHGGTMYGNWTNAAMALNRLDGVEDRLKNAIKRWEEINAGLNKIPGVSIRALDNGTNIYTIEIDITIDPKKLQEALSKLYIRMGRPNEKGLGQITVNDTLLNRDANYIVEAFASAIKTAKS